MAVIVFFFFYQVLQLMALPGIILLLVRRYIKGKPSLMLNWAERWGYVPCSSPHEKRKIIWIHAVSVGEVLSLQWLAHELEKKYNLCVYLTVGTAAAYNLAKKNLVYSYLSFLPFDFLLPIVLAFRRIRPQVLLIVEAEMWPNLLMWAAFLKVPLYKINARISATSKKRYPLIRFFYRPLLGLFEKIYTQSKEDLELFKSMGIASEKAAVGGNIKVINVLYKQLHLPCQVPRCPQQTTTEQKPYVFLLGSLHQGELDYYIACVQRLWQDGYAIKLVIAPRYFHWKDDLIRKITLLGRPAICWTHEGIKKSMPTGELHSIIPRSSATKDILSQLLAKDDIVLVCLLGRLFDMYECADLFFLGGTLVPVGGHNLLEPAVWAKLSVIGPYYANCADITDQLEQVGGVVKVESVDQLYHTIIRLLQDPAQLTQRGKSARAWLVHEAAFVEKHLQELIKSFSV